MKKQLIHCILIMLAICQHVDGQKRISVSLTYNMTVHLIFSKPIQYWDVGSSDILAESKGRVLKLAPRREFFESTGLTVFTEDNTWYTILLEYKKDITQWIYCVSDSVGLHMDNDPSQEMHLKNDTQKDTPVTDTIVLNDRCRKILKYPETWLDIGGIYKGVYLSVTNCTLWNDKWFLTLEAGNRSSLPYTIGFIQLKVVNKVKLKRSSVQDDMKTLIYRYPVIQTLPPGNQPVKMIFVYDAFRLTSDQKLVLEMAEQGGGRNIFFDAQEDIFSKSKTGQE